MQLTNEQEITVRFNCIILDTKMTIMEMERGLQSLYNDLDMTARQEELHQNALELIPIKTKNIYQTLHFLYVILGYGNHDIINLLGTSSQALFNWKARAGIKSSALNSLRRLCND